VRFANAADHAASFERGNVIREVILRGARSRNQQRLLCYARGYLERTLACASIRERGRVPVPQVCIALWDWEHVAADATSFDRLFSSLDAGGDFRVVLWARDWLSGVQSALELLNRYQRLLPLPTSSEPLPSLSRVLEAHRCRYAFELPPSRANYQHALDTWRWVLRLAPAAGLTLQLAALFHELAPAWVDERSAEAAISPALREAVAPLGLPEWQVLRVTELIAQRQRPGADHQARLLRDADDLSFFSLQSWDYLRRQGPAEARKKVERCLARMSRTAVCSALMTRQPLQISEMIESALAAQGSPNGGFAPEPAAWPEAPLLVREHARSAVEQHLVVA
jgi:hypothetical protein